MEAVAALLGPGVDRLFHLEEAFAAHHPAEPLYYCQFLSTVPASGPRDRIGLPAGHAAAADADELPAYHEATSPRNRVLYERHGYVSLGELVLPDGGPTVWRMWRDPR